MKKISAHDEREIKDYLKHNPTSLRSAVAKKMKPKHKGVDVHDEDHGFYVDYSGLSKKKMPKIGVK